MHKTLLAASLLAACLTAPASALPLLVDPAPEANIVKVYDGCGPFGHRGPLGFCRPGGQLGGYIRGLSCPAGWHIGPMGRRCWPNRGPMF